jgi:hypothetical protein
MAEGVFMDVDAVRNFSKNFNNISQVLKGVSRTLEMLMNTLRATAFIGLVGGAVVAQYIEFIKPQIDQMADKCEELSGDLSASADAYERGDELGSTRFH